MSDTEKTSAIEQLIDEFVDSFGRKIILREEVTLIKRKKLANDDCAGVGPVGKFFIKGKPAYPAESLKIYLKSQCSSTWRGQKSA